MKTIPLSITAVLLAAQIALAQATDSTIQALIKNKLIEKSQAKDITKLLKDGGEPGNAAIMQALFYTEYKKLTGIDPSFPTQLTFGDEKPATSEQTKINQELTAYLSKLKSASLISEAQFQHFNGKVINSEYVHVLQLLPPVTFLVAMKEHMNPVGLKQFADKLQRAGIVTAKYSPLISDIENEKLEIPIDFLNYCDKAIIIREKDYSNEPETYLEEMHRKTASLIPDLAFTDFQFQIVVDSTWLSSDTQSHDFLVSLKSNGRIYRQKSYYRLYSPDKNEYFGNKIDQQEYYKIFNKVLSDLQSPYRLHEVKSHAANAAEEFFGIIALTKEQADTLHGGGVYFSPSYESFKAQLTSKRIDQAIEAYRSIGLLSHLTARQIDNAKQKVSAQENRNLNDVLMAFPDVIHSFDAELANLDDPYAELIRDFARISHQAFNATDASDDFDIEKGKNVTVKFRVGSKSYSKTFRIEDDWIDPDFLEFAKSAAIENQPGGQFYELYTGGQEASVIYLTKAQYDHLRANELLVFADQWESQEE